MPADPHRFHMYILRCADGSYYVGVASDLVSRIELHNAGNGAAYTARRRPVTVVHSESFNSMSEARQREIQIKKWSRAKKQALIAGNFDKLHKLSQRYR